MKKRRPRTICVLMSGGMDSAVLCGHFLRRGAVVWPLYVRCGHRWESAELYWLKRFLRAMGAQYPRQIQPVTITLANVTTLYGNHWSTKGAGVPGARTPDRAVYLPGRNLILLTQAALFCERRGIAAVALGHLRSNPFSDSRPAFFAAVARAVRLATGHHLKILTPFARMKKHALHRYAGSLPLHLTFSCLKPKGHRPCGRCNKCAEFRSTPCCSRN